MDKWSWEACIAVPWPATLLNEVIRIFNCRKGVSFLWWFMFLEVINVMHGRNRLIIYYHQVEADVPKVLFSNTTYQFSCRRILDFKCKFQDKDSQLCEREKKVSWLTSQLLSKESLLTDYWVSGWITISRSIIIKANVQWPNWV